MAFIFSKSKFEEDVEKATSELAPMGSEDLALSLDIADMIKSGTVAPKDALRTLRKRITHPNPNVQLMSLKLLDICVKNGGKRFLLEISSVEFMEFYAETALSVSLNAKVGQAMMDLIGNWASATMNIAEMGPIYSTYVRLKRTGNWNAPDIKSSQALLDTITPPDWTDSDVCERCRSAFTVTNRKHHCRACGRTFCQSCSSKTMPLLDLGIKDPVRVCDGCYARKGVPPKQSDENKATPEKTPTISPRTRPATQLKEEEDLALAIRLSLEEQKPVKTLSSKGGNTNYFGPRPSQKPREPTPASQEYDSDDDVKKAIEASLADMSGAVSVSPKESREGLSSESSRQVQKPRAAPAHLTDTEIENITLFAKLVSNLEADPTSSMQVPQNRELLELYHQIITLHPKLYNDLQKTLGRWETLDRLQRHMNESIRRYDERIQDGLRRLQGPTAASAMQPPPVVGSPAAAPRMGMERYGQPEPAVAAGYYTTPSVPYALGTVPPTPAQAPVQTPMQAPTQPPAATQWGAYRGSTGSMHAPQAPPHPPIPADPSPTGRPQSYHVPQPDVGVQGQGYYTTAPVHPHPGAPAANFPPYGAPQPAYQSTLAEPAVQETKPPVAEAPPLIEL